MPAKRPSKKYDNRPIGLFDSGLGGLTVVRAVRDALPGEDVIYLGDTARVPYGNRSPETVELFARQDLAFLERFGIKAAVAACNTVSALALPNILPEKRSFPLGGVILAGVEAVLATGRRKVAVLGAVEVVNPDMPPTVDAAALAQMSRRGQIKGCTIDGPLAIDNAVSEESAKHKGIKSEVAGHADVLIVPEIESGNILVKSIVYFSRNKTAAIVLGTKAPIVLTSRADSAETKLLSIASAVTLAAHQGK